MGLWSVFCEFFRLTEPPKLPKRYARQNCLICGGTFAISSKGIWKHKCARKP